MLKIGDRQLKVKTQEMTTWRRNVKKEEVCRGVSGRQLALKKLEKEGNGVILNKGSWPPPFLTTLKKMWSSSGVRRGRGRELHRR